MYALLFVVSMGALLVSAEEEVQDGPFEELPFAKIDEMGILSVVKGLAQQAHLKMLVEVTDGWHVHCMSLDEDDWRYCNARSKLKEIQLKEAERFIEEMSK
jgi:hypothetical protein